MDATLIQLSTPLHLTADQHVRVDRLALQTQQLRAALCAWTWARTLGGDPDLTAHLRRVTRQGLPSLRPPEGQGAVPPLSLAEVTTCLRRTLAESDLTLPTATVTALAVNLVKQLKPLTGRRVYAGQLPQPDPDPRVPLDGDTLAVDPYHVHVTGWPELLVCDLWRLPLGLGDALTASGATALHGLAHEAQRLQQRDRDGDPGALAALHDLAWQHAPVWGRTGTPGPVAQTRPHRSGHATLHQQEAPDGTRQWVITWSVRVPAAWLPRAGHRDVVGVDPGVRHPLAWCDGTRAGYMERGSLTGSTAPLSAGAAPTTLFADAVRRHAWFARTATALDTTLRLLLTYKTVAIEDTHWAALADDGHAWPRDVMTLTGVTDVLPWLRALAPLTGTRVRRVPAWHASQGCGKCGCRGIRDIAANEFRCRRCSHRGCADVNAAMYARLVTLLGQAKP